MCSFMNGMFGKAIASGCCKQNSKLGLEVISKCAVTRGDKIAWGGKVCDCTVLHGVSSPRIIFAKLKRGGVKFDHAVEKLASGMRLLPQLNRAVFGSRPDTLSIFLLVERRLAKTFYGPVHSHRLKPRCKTHSVMATGCGATLAGVDRELAQVEAGGRQWDTQ